LWFRIVLHHFSQLSEAVLRLSGVVVKGIRKFFAGQLLPNDGGKLAFAAVGDKPVFLGCNRGESYKSNRVFCRKGTQGTQSQALMKFLLCDQCAGIRQTQAFSRGFYLGKRKGDSKAKPHGR
jgi:hypothetical protein